jgi:sulfur carrier protein
MKITVNGENVVLQQSITVKELIVKKAEMPEYVTVQLNEQLVDSKNFATMFLKDGDVVEFLYFMGGGQR